MSRKKPRRPGSKRRTMKVAREIASRLAPFPKGERREILDEMLQEIQDGPHGPHVSEPLIRAVDGLNDISNTINNFRNHFRGQSPEEIKAGVANYLRSDYPAEQRADFLDSMIAHSGDVPNLPPIVPWLKDLRAKIGEIGGKVENTLRLKDHYEGLKHEICGHVNDVIDDGISDSDIRILLQSADSSEMRRLIMNVLTDRRSELPASVQSLLDVYGKIEGGDSALKEAMDALGPVVRQSIIPEPNTVHNFEIGVMSLGRIEAKFDELNTAAGDALVQLIRLSFSEKNAKAYSLLSWYMENSVIPCFAYEWRGSGFARVEVGHKLAAALCLTDAPPGVESPWKTWSLVVPSGMLPDQEADMDGSRGWMEGRIRLKVERIWCSGSKPVAVVGTVLNAIHRMTGEQYWPISPFEVRYLPGSFIRPLENLVRGVCLCISDRSEARSGDWTARPSGSGSKRKGGAPKAGELYRVGQAVQIDLRDELRERLSGGGGGGGSPKVQFLVRGHWRNQPHGKGRALRRRRWIEPFWKGPEETRVLLRGYDVKEDD